MSKLLLCLGIAACSGGSASMPTPSNVSTTQPPPPAPNPARKRGYPTSAECEAAIDHVLATARKDPTAATNMAAHGNEAALWDEGVQECRREWLLGKLDCIHAASSVEEVAVCRGASNEIPDGVDASSAPGRATPAQCKAVLDHLVALVPQAFPDETAKRVLADKCMGWRPFKVTCMRFATSPRALGDCNR